MTAQDQIEIRERKMRPLVVGALVVAMVPPVAWSHPYLYVTVQGDHTVSVIDMADDQIKDKISGVNDPYNLAATPDGSRLVVTNDDTTVTLIDIATSAVIGTLSLKGPAFSVAFSPDGKVAYLVGCTEPGIASCDGQIISVVDMSRFAVTRTIPLPPGGFWPGVAIDHDGNRLYVSNDNGISRVDVFTGTVTKLSPIGGGAMSIAVGRDAHHIYVAGKDEQKHENELVVIDTKNDSVITETPLDVYPIGIAISPDESQLYMTDCDDKTAEQCLGGFLSVFDTAKRKVIRRIALGGGTYPYGVAVSPDGTRVYVADDNSPGMVTVVDARRDVVLAQIKVGDTPTGVTTVSVPATIAPAPRVDSTPSLPNAEYRRATFPNAIGLESPDTRYVVRNVKGSAQYALQLENTLTGKERTLISYSNLAVVAWNRDSSRLSVSASEPRSDCLIFDAGDSQAAVDVRQQFDKQLNGFEPSEGLKMFLSCQDWWDQNVVSVSVVIWNPKINKVASVKRYHYNLLQDTIAEESNSSGH